MSIRNYLKEVLFNLRDGIQAALLFITANSQWLILFNASPAALILRPLLGLIILSLLMYQAYELIALPFEPVKLILLIGSSLNVALTNAAIFGGLAAALIHQSFLLGPWLMIAALGIGVIQHASLLIFNLYKAFLAHERPTRMHHLQAAINHLFSGLLFSASLITFALLAVSPAAPLVLSSFAILGGSLLVVMIVWRALKPSTKQTIKQYFGLSKESAEQELEVTHHLKVEPANRMELANYGNKKADQVGYSPHFWSITINERLHPESPRQRPRGPL